MSLPSKKRLKEMFKYYEGKLKPVDLDIAPASAGKAEIIRVETTDQRALLLRKMLEAANSTSKVDDALDMANDLLDGHGVEAIRGDYQVDRYYYDIVGLYVNMGDPYIPTLLYDTDRGKFYVGGYGDWVEANTKRYGIY